MLSNIRILVILFGTAVTEQTNLKVRVRVVKGRRASTTSTVIQEFLVYTPSVLFLGLHEEIITRLRTAGRTEQALQYADPDTMQDLRAECLVALARTAWIKHQQTLQNLQGQETEKPEMEQKDKVIGWLTEALKFLEG